MGRMSTSPRSKSHIYEWISTSCGLCSLLSMQDPHQLGLQQRCHSGRSQEARLSAELGETALEKQRHSATKLIATTHLCNERIEAPYCCYKSDIKKKNI